MDRKTKFKVCRMGFLKGFLSALAVTYLFYRNLAISCMISVIYGFYNVFRERKEYQKKQWKRYWWILQGDGRQRILIIL